MTDRRQLTTIYKQNLESNIIKLIAEIKQLDLRKAIDIYYSSKFVLSTYPVQDGSLVSMGNNEDIASIISDLKIKTFLKERIHAIIFSDLSIAKKRILIKKLKKDGLEPQFIRMFLRLLEYISEI